MSGASAASMGLIEEPMSSVTVLTKMEPSSLACHGSYKSLVGSFPACLYILSESRFCTVEPQGIRLLVHCYLLIVNSCTSIQKTCNKHADTKIFRQFL